jgi:serine/threonine protein kinase
MSLKAFNFLHSRNIIHGDLKGVRDLSKPRFATVLTRV